jgi:hypothetical protein
MHNPERLKLAQAKLSDTHRKLHDVQTETMVELRHTVSSLQLGQRGIKDSVRATRDIIDAAIRASESAEAASDRTERAIKTLVKTLELVNDAHDAMITLYEADSELEEIAHTDTP